jgi:hypothetical protein
MIKKQNRKSCHSDQYLAQSGKLPGTDIGTETFGAQTVCQVVCRKRSRIRAIEVQVSLALLLLLAEWRGWTKRYGTMAWEKCDQNSFFRASARRLAFER